MLKPGRLRRWWSVQSVNLPVFFVNFCFLFVATGVGNSFSFWMISDLQVKVVGGDRKRW